MATNDYRHTCQTGTRRHKDIGVEVKGMRDADAASSQMPAETVRTEEGGRAVEATAEWKGLGATDLRCQGAVSINATRRHGLINVRQLFGDSDELPLGASDLKIVHHQEQRRLRMPRMGWRDWSAEAVRLH